MTINDEMKFRPVASKVSDSLKPPHSRQRKIKSKQNPSNEKRKLTELSFISLSVSQRLNKHLTQDNWSVVRHIDLK